MPAVEVTGQQVLAFRLRRHLLDPRGRLDAVHVARRLCGVQAQVASSAAQAVAARQEVPDRHAVRQALADRSLVKTWTVRGTLHLMPADEVAAYLAVVGAARTWLKASWQKAFVSAADLDRVAVAVTDALVGRELTREELVEEVAARTGEPQLAAHVRSGWGAVLKPLAWQGLLCHGPDRGGRVTFVRPADVVPGWGGLPAPDDAARVVVPAYLGVHGPAGPVELDAWLTRGATPKRIVRGWFADLGEALAPVSVEGRALWARAEDVDELRDSSPSAVVRLLPGFDQWVLGPGTADALILAPVRRAAVSRAGGWIAPVVAVGGRVVGTWEAGDSQLAVELFPESDGVDAGALDAEVARVAGWLERDLRLTVAGS